MKCVKITCNKLRKINFWKLKNLNCQYLQKYLLPVPFSFNTIFDWNIHNYANYLRIIAQCTTWSERIQNLIDNSFFQQAKLFVTDARFKQWYNLKWMIVLLYCSIYNIQETCEESNSRMSQFDLENWQFQGQGYHRNQ